MRLSSVILSLLILLGGASQALADNSIVDLSPSASPTSTPTPTVAPTVTPTPDVSLTSDTPTATPSNLPVTGNSTNTFLVLLILASLTAGAYVLAHKARRS